jgi:hypothetical protein
MRKLVITVSLAALLAACGDKTETTQVSTETKTVETSKQTPVPAAPVDKAALVEQAKGAVQKLGGTLKGELETAMKAGGPVDALTVCQKRAPEIAKSVSEESGMQVGRVSLKNRNPNGAANEWQSKVLNEFDSRKAAGEDPNSLVYSDIVDNEFRFMKAIPTGQVCLSCHGTAISPAVTAKLKELYPKDIATGYKEGDIRGAFVAIKKLAQ